MQLAKPVWWTWDHSTNWTVNQPGKQNMGASNFYGKCGEQFVAEYTRAIRFAAAHGIEAIFIAGLLRDGHGGLDAARKVAQIGRDAGVRICGITGLLAYGGIYYEGDSPWSLDRFLKAHPECLAVDREGRPLVKGFGNGMSKKVRHACGSNAKVRDFVLRSVEWLFKALPELGGLQFETGDTGVCQCAACRKRYSSEAEMISYDDMAELYPKVAEIVLGSKPEAWAVCETYAHFLPRRKKARACFACGMPSEVPALLSGVPKEAHFQWVGDGFIDPKDTNYEWVGEGSGDPPWQAGEGIPDRLRQHRHIMRAHYGTHWSGRVRHRLAIERIRKLCRLSASAKLERISLFGEGSAFHANAEFNYLAGCFFSTHPEASMEAFAAEVMAPRLGGPGLAGDFIEWNRQSEENVLDESIFQKLMAYASRTDGAPQRRWLWLGSFLQSQLWDREY
ncbi:MAG: hypothetical protein HY291_08585 [Planctomycetes bacterium]|nr:hypothetical protein [Planctomycetota bacterium]